MANKYLSVAALTKYLFYKFDTDLNLRNVYLKAEISNVRLSKGILYFVLKDSEAELGALMYQNTWSKLSFELTDGMTVLVQGKVSLYEKRGTYAMTVFSMEQAGLGNCYLQFIQLKEKLEKEGLFDEAHKKPIPTISNVIGVITSGTGDAMHDIFSTIEKRFPLSKILFYPSIVQGVDAPKSMIASIRKANLDKKADVLIIARGGGSTEDLSCFNDEELARAIYASDIPIISGVGHEADYTICDFVSSHRAPTPTGAAVIATPDKNDILKDLTIKQNKLKNYILQKIQNIEHKVESLSERYGLKRFIEKINVQEHELEKTKKHLILLSPKRKIELFEMKVSEFHESLFQSLKLSLSSLEDQLKHSIEKMILLNPLNIMEKGYTIVMQNDKIVTRKEHIKEDTFTIKFYDGDIKVKKE